MQVIRKSKAILILQLGKPGVTYPQRTEARPQGRYMHICVHSTHWSGQSRGRDSPAMSNRWPSHPKDSCSAWKSGATLTLGPKITTSPEGGVLDGRSVSQTDQHCRHALHHTRRDSQCRLREGLEDGSVANST